MMRFTNCDWKLHPDYVDILVSDSGLIFSYKRGYWTELKQSDNGTGYLRVGVGHSNPRYVHILVAQTFLNDWFPNAEVDHIDGNKRNNDVTNLEWVTKDENIRRSWVMGLRRPPQGTPIRIVETGQVFVSQCECARAIDDIQGNIALCLTNKRRSHRGFTFEYVKGENR